jgi:hypothetical protein
VCDSDLIVEFYKNFITSNKQKIQKFDKTKINKFMPKSFRYYGSLQVDWLTDSKRASPPTALHGLTL